MTQKNLLTSVPSAFKFQKCQLIQNQIKLSYEVWINFRKLPKTTVAHIETINITCTSTCTFRRSEFSVSPVSTQLPHKLAYNCLQAEGKMMLNRYSRFSLLSTGRMKNKSILYLAFQN